MTESTPGTVLITGAAGFIGSHCVRRFIREGYAVRALVRDPKATIGSLSESGASVYRCELPDEIDAAAFAGPVRALVHCAYTTRFRDLEDAERTNITGMKQLLKLAAEAHVEQIVFISTVQARADSRSHYGKSKYVSEQLLKLEHDLIIRPGMVIGRGGVFDRLRATIRRTRVLPLFYGGRQSIQTVWIEDLIGAIAAGIANRTSGIRHVAEPTPVPIREFYRQVAAIDGVRPVLVPVPGTPALVLLRVAESLGLTLPISSENLIGLKQLRPVEVIEDLRALGVTVRPFGQSLALLAQTTLG